VGEWGRRNIHKQVGRRIIQTEGTSWEEKKKVRGEVLGFLGRPAEEKNRQGLGRKCHKQNAQGR